jgi:predicted RNA-binding Zn-ribbon protein involved in translation (DUF1610 family)
MAEKKTTRGGEVRCLNCFERIFPPAGAERFACPKCKMEWRISWASADVPKIRGPVWEKMPRKPQ